MNIELEHNLESRLEDIARHRSVSVAGLVEEIVRQYLNSLGETPEEWVQSTQKQLAGTWPAEDFSDWQPPNAS